MEIFWINTGNSKTDNSIVESLNRNGNYDVCNLSQDSRTSDISYFTFCHIQLLKSLTSAESKNAGRDLIIAGLDFSKLDEHQYELLFIIATIFPMDPILVGKFPNFLSERYGINLDKVVPFNGDTEFIVDLEHKLDVARKNKKSELSRMISIFNANEMVLTLNPNFSKLIRLKGNNGVTISYEEFVSCLDNEISKNGNFLREISEYGFLREHTPVDLFVRKYLKKL